MNTARLRELDKQHLWHPFTHMQLWLEDDPLVITAADGFHLIDSDGNRYLDGVSSLWCNVHGHRVPEIDQAIRDQLEKVAHTTMLGLASEPAILLAAKLTEIAPAGLTRVFYSDSGATAAEIALKMAVQYWHNLGQPDKHEFIAFTQAYHGDTFGAISVGRIDAFHRPYAPLLFTTHIADCLATVESLLAAHTGRIAAVCIEPIVQGAGGILLHPPGLLSEVRKLATAHNTLLIADEVAVGFGRTGRMFACEHENVSPDLMCLAKGITGGYLPLAATLATEKIFNAFLGKPSEGKTFFHGHTYTGNPLACAAALASLDLMQRNDLIAAVQRKSAKLAEMLEELKPFLHVGQIRQKGFMVGIDLVQNKTPMQAFDPKLRMGAQLCRRIRDRGVILRPLGDVIVLMPPLAMELDDLGQIVKAVAHEVRSISV